MSMLNGNTWKKQIYGPVISGSEGNGNGKTNIIISEVEAPSTHREILREEDVG